MKILGLTGWSGAGKTTLLVHLIPELKKRGISVSTLKHAHHNFDVDHKGKDSYRHREAGAQEVMVASNRRWALMHEHGDNNDTEPKAADLLRHFNPVDLVLIEGFKKEPHPKIEIYRQALLKPLLAPNDPTILAIAADAPLAGTMRPVLRLNHLPEIVEFILDYLSQPPSSQGRGSHGAIK